MCCMLVHKYKVLVFEGLMDMIHADGIMQTRLYVPNKGVIGFRNMEYVYVGESVHVDFFSDEPEMIAEAEDHIKGKVSEESKVEYIGQIELPDKILNEVISTGKTLTQAQASFQKSAKTLVDLVKE